MIFQEVSGRKFRPTPLDDGQIHIIPQKAKSTKYDSQTTISSACVNHLNRSTTLGRYRTCYNRYTRGIQHTTVVKRLDDQGSSRINPEFVK